MSFWLSWLLLLSWFGLPLGTNGHILGSAEDNLLEYNIQKTDIDYNSARQLPNCGQQYTLTLGIPQTFTSPYYPNYFIPNINCLWVIYGPINSVINVTCAPFSVPCYSGNGMGFSRTGKLDMSDAEYFCGIGSTTYLSTGPNMTVNLQAVTSGYVKCVAQAITDTRTSTTTKTTTKLTTKGTTMPTQATTKLSTQATTKSPTQATTTAKLVTKASSSTIAPMTTTKSSATTTGPVCECGVKGQSRIVGGNVTAPGEWPWQVMLRYGDSQEFGCGGVLIHNQWVLTAGHCIKDIANTPNSLVIELGAYYRIPNGAARQVRTIQQIILHENYDSVKIDNDISLLKLASPVNYSSTVRPVCLPINYNMEVFTGQKATVTGWGAMSEGGSLADVLMELPLPVLATDNCKPYYNNSVGSKISSNMFCTYAQGQDACQGDSGGPLNWQNPVTGRITVIGLVSWGVGCARDRRPGVYTKIANYIPWIQQKTGLNFCTA